MNACKTWLKGLLECTLQIVKFLNVVFSGYFLVRFKKAQELGVIPRPVWCSMFQRKRKLNQGRCWLYFAADVC